MFGYILIDTPPIGSVADALNIATHCDGTVLVVRSGSTVRKIVDNSVQLLKRTETPLRRIVLNRADMNIESNLYYYRYYRSGYYYNHQGYGYGYGQQAKKITKLSDGRIIYEKSVFSCDSCGHDNDLATGALAAEWHPSRTQTGAALSGTEVTVADAAGNAMIFDVANGGITVTNVADTLAGLNSLDAATNNKTNVVYEAALATDSVSTMLAKFANAEEADAAIAVQIAANNAATVERLNALRDELSSKIEQLKADGASEDEIAAYEPATLFDVSMYGDVAQALENGSSVEIPVRVDGITSESDVLALHFMGGLMPKRCLKN